MTEDALGGGGPGRGGRVGCDGGGSDGADADGDLRRLSVVRGDVAKGSTGRRLPVEHGCLVDSCSILFTEQNIEEPIDNYKSSNLWSML